jgi:transposase
MINPETLAYVIAMLCAGGRRRTAPGLSIRSIAATAGISPTTVRYRREQMETCKISRSKLLRMAPEELWDVLNPRPPLPVRWGAIRRQWTRYPRWSKRDLWGWYREEEIGHGEYRLLSYEHFARELGKFPEVLEPRMRQVFEPGQVIFVDFGGKKGLSYRGPSGKEQPAKLFVAVAGFSLLTFATCVDNEGEEDWLLACTRMLDFYGGVPLAVVPDNLKSAVQKPRPAPVINPQFEKWAQHYRVAIQPARTYTAPDKALVESSVKHVQNLLLKDMANKRFPSLSALNQAVAERLQVFNARKITGRSVSRWEQYQKEKKAMRPLPRAPFALPLRTFQQTVPADYTIVVDGHRYTVPYQLIGRLVEIRVSKLHVEVMRRGRKVATHDLAPPGGIGTALTAVVAHRPPEHQAMARNTRSDVETWAATVGPKMVELIARHFRRVVPLQGLQEACDVRALSRLHEPGVLEWAAHEALLVREHGYAKLKKLLATPPGADDPAVHRAVTPRKPRAAPHPRAVRARVKGGATKRPAKSRRAA